MKNSGIIITYQPDFMANKQTLRNWKYIFVYYLARDKILSGTSILEGNMKFICDDNLGKLARYMRFLGFDVAYKKNISNSHLLGISLDESRTILTRDRKIIEKTLVRDFLLVEDNHWASQLKQVISKFSLIPVQDCIFKRCSEDNTVTLQVKKEAIKNEVYPFIYEYHDNFRRCPLCQKIYWHGSHAKAVLAILKRHGFLAD
ncbi:MAG: Mut7-C RNAse domain-containing protein [Candidatus Zixiibacteriota bacterium]